MQYSTPFKVVHEGLAHVTAPVALSFHGGQSTADALSAARPRTTKPNAFLMGYLPS
jgi:hypothetical protein